jgi:hypothetical protein
MCEFHTEQFEREGSASLSLIIFHVFTNGLGVFYYRGVFCFMVLVFAICNGGVSRAGSTWENERLLLVLFRNMITYIYIYI